MIILWSKPPLSVRSGAFVAKHIEPIKDKQVQPNGVDLRVEKISDFVNNGTIKSDQNDVTVPAKHEVQKEKDGVYSLGRGVYELRYKEKISIPTATVGLVLPRSSLMRCGVMVNTALWDQGYSGIGMGLLQVGNGIDIEPGARVAQMVFISADDGNDSYDGQYQGENLND